MKNIHTLPTNKPSRLHLIEDTLTITSEYKNSVCDAEVNIYITSYEEIKEVDWFLRKNKIHQLRWDDGNGHLYTKNGLKIYKSSSKKIILTTDTDLITDGVQSIDDEFLEWYINNPSCEEVEIEKYFHEVGDAYDYEIIIPKEELKETLEKAAECKSHHSEEDFIRGAKWQQERSYSELELFINEVKDKIDSFEYSVNQKSYISEYLDEWFKQFKK